MRAAWRTAERKSVCASKPRHDIPIGRGRAVFAHKKYRWIKSPWVLIAMKVMFLRGGETENELRGTVLLGHIAHVAVSRYVR